MLKIGVLISGNGSNLQSLLDNIDNGNIDGEVCAVISDKSGAYGLERAQKHGIPTFSFDKSKYSNEEINKKILKLLKDMDISLVVLAGLLSILSSEIIREYKNAIINIHPSLIPSFCGPGFYGIKVHESAIKYGVKVSGCTVHFVDEGTDTGPIILQSAVKVLDYDTPECLQKRILEQEHILLPKAVKLICEGRVIVSGRKVYIKEDKND